MKTVEQMALVFFNEVSRNRAKNQNKRTHAHDTGQVNSYVAAMTTGHQRRRVVTSMGG